jgi:hypothetical protein
MTQPAPHNGRPIDREYLDLRLSEFESKFRLELAELRVEMHSLFSQMLLWVVATVAIGFVGVIVTVAVS